MLTSPFIHRIQTNLASTLGAVFDKLRSQLLAIDEWMTAAYIGFARQADAEHEAGQGMPRDWSVVNPSVRLCLPLKVAVFRGGHLVQTTH